MPRDIFPEEEEEEEESESTTHNVTNGTHNAVNQQNGRSTNATTAAACSSHPNGNANQPCAPDIIKIDAALKTKIAALLIKKQKEFDRGLLSAETNQVMGNSNSLLRAAMKLDRELAGDSPDSGPLALSWTSHSLERGPASDKIK
jgi:hypothetical protein